MTPAGNEIGWDISLNNRTEKVLKVATALFTASRLNFKEDKSPSPTHPQKAGLETGCMEYKIYILATRTEFNQRNSIGN